MLSATLQDGLTDYAIGEQVRTLRLKKKMGLVELGSTRPVAGAALEIERGRLFPTLPTLLRIALVFSVGLDSSSPARGRSRSSRWSGRRSASACPIGPGARDVAYRFESLDYPATERRFNSYYAEFLPVAPDKLGRTRIPASSSSTLMQGTLSMLKGEEHALDAGDSIYFDSTLPTPIGVEEPGMCSALVVTSQSS